MKWTDTILPFAPGVVPVAQPPIDAVSAAAVVPVFSAGGGYPEKRAVFLCADAACIAICRRSVILEKRDLRDRTRITASYYKSG